MPRPLWSRKTTIKAPTAAPKAPVKATKPVAVKVSPTPSTKFKDQTATPTKGVKVSPTPSAKFKKPKGAK